MGMEIRLAHPEGYGPNPAIVALAERLAAANGGNIVVGRDPRQLAHGSDALYTDVWVSMGQEDQSRARLASFAGYSVDASLLELAGAAAVATAEVIDGPRSLAFEQAENRLHVQKAFLVESLGR
jgi:ornithine carbamoyltransferase